MWLGLYFCQWNFLSHPRNSFRRTGNSASIRLRGWSASSWGVGLIITSLKPLEHRGNIVPRGLLRGSRLWASQTADGQNSSLPKSRRILFADRKFLNRIRRVQSSSCNPCKIDAFLALFWRALQGAILVKIHRKGDNLTSKFSLCFSWASRKNTFFFFFCYFCQNNACKSVNLRG